MQQTTHTTRRSVSTKQRPGFKMRCCNENNNNNNKNCTKINNINNNNNKYNYKPNNSSMLNIFLFFLSCCCACALWSTMTVEAANPIKTAGSTLTTTTTTISPALASYLDVNSVENDAVSATGGVDGVIDGDGGVGSNNNIPSADVAADEILQLPHAFRHQEHYSHRIEQAVNDFKRAQLEQQLQLKQLQQQKQQQQQQNDAKSSAANATKVENNYNSNNWQESTQTQQEEHHHRRHEQHLKQNQPQFEVQQQQKLNQHHHLRHHNRHHASWEQRVFPVLRHQRHQQHERHLRPAITTTTTTTTTLSPLYASNELETLPRGASINVTRALQTRYFDRDGLYSKSRAAAASHVSAVWVRTTRGPRVRHFNANSWPSAKKLDEREFSDEAHYDDDEVNARDSNDNVDEDDDGAYDASAENGIATNQLNGRRFTLKLSAQDAAMNGKPGATLSKNTNVVADAKVNKEKDDAEEDNENNGDDNDDDDADDDYSYEDDELPKNPNAYASNGVKEKISVKRYTNPFKSSYKSSPMRHYETAYEDDSEMEENNNRNLKHSVSNNNYNNNNNYNSNNFNQNNRHNFNKNNNNNNDNIDTVDSGDVIDASDNDDADDDDNSSSSESDSIFSSDKWNRIEQQHHLKQLQHQREVQRRLQHHSMSGSSSSSSRNAAISNSANTNAAKRQTKHDDDVESIFSRNYIPGTLTRQKQEELGTLEAVHQTRRNHVMKQMQNKALANAHAKQIFSEASCRLPQRRIERIQRDPTKIYTPHCTVLHRCADDTGCCKSDRQTCAPKRTRSVDLYFFVKGINDKRGSIERLTFINHTECHCVDKAKEQPAEYGGNTGLYGGLIGNSQMLRRATILNCNCPKLYEKILQEDGFCRCDCSSGNTGCDWLKRGMEHFSMIDRKCISEGRCKPPTCAYGSYIKKHGRCPRREEQLSATLIGGAGGGGAPPLTTNSIKSRGYH